MYIYIYVFATVPQGTRRAMRLLSNALILLVILVFRGPRPLVIAATEIPGGPPNAHLAPLGCHLAHLIHNLGANMSENAPKNPIFEATLPEISPKMSQSSLPTTPKLSKTCANLRFFKVFRYPAHVPKSPKNAFKTIPKPPKLS